MTEQSLAHSGTEASAELAWRERQEQITPRTTRGMLLFNGGAVRHIAGDAWHVASATEAATRSKHQDAAEDGTASAAFYYLVDLADESCTCPDYEYRASVIGIACKHVYAASIARATRRSGAASLGSATRRIRELQDIARHDQDDGERQRALAEIERLRRR